jgi:hypothetical protein
MAGSDGANKSQIVRDAGFMEASLGALAKILPGVYGSPDTNNQSVRAVLAPNRNFLRRMYQVRGNGDGKDPLGMPFFGYLPTSFQVNRNSYNFQAMRRFGANGGVIKDGQDFIVLHLVPTTIQVQVAFIGNDYGQLLKFSNEWIRKHRNLSFELEITGTGRTIPIQVRGNEQLQVPDLPAESDSGELFTYETDLQVDSYSGIIRRVPGVVTINGNIKVVNIDAAVEEALNDASLVANNIPVVLARASNSNPEL